MEWACLYLSKQKPKHKTQNGNVCFRARTYNLAKRINYFLRETNPRVSELLAGSLNIFANAENWIDQAFVFTLARLDVCFAGVEDEGVWLTEKKKREDETY